MTRYQIFGIRVAVVGTRFRRSGVGYCAVYPTGKYPGHVGSNVTHWFNLTLVPFTVVGSIGILKTAYGMAFVHTALHWPDGLKEIIRGLIWSTVRCDGTLDGICGPLGGFVSVAVTSVYGFGTRLVVTLTPLTVKGFAVAEGRRSTN